MGARARREPDQEVGSLGAWFIRGQTKLNFRIFLIDFLRWGDYMDSYSNEGLQVHWVEEGDAFHHVDFVLSQAVNGVAPIYVCRVDRDVACDDAF